MDIKKARRLIEISLENGGIIPITKAAANLADTIQAAKDHPILVTQNGYGIGIVTSIELFRQLRELAYEGLDHLSAQETRIEISLENGGIIPVTKAAANLADTIQAAKEHPTLITQKGYGIGVVMSIGLFRQLSELAREGLDRLEFQEQR